MPQRRENKSHRKETASTRTKRDSSPKLLRCPGCGEMTLFWDKCTNQGVCLNFNCKLSAR